VNEILLSNEVIIYLLSETLLYGLLLIAFLVTLGLVKYWDFSAFTPLQFKLENRSYLLMSIVLFVLLLKMLLLPYFVYTIDTLSNHIPGAMCGAGVIKANPYGNPLLGLKIIILFLSALWLGINRLDLLAKHYPYLRLKSWFFMAIFIFLSAEYLLDILYFTQIDTSNPVTCCSVIFGQTGGSNGLPFHLNITKLLLLFYLFYLLIVLTALSQKVFLNILASVGFAVIAYYSVVYFFGTYIYQLPTHQCPFCMLQDHYYYVGYLIWGLLLLGLFFAFNSAVMYYGFKQTSLKSGKLSLLLLTLFVAICTAYVGVYYIKNGVLL